MSKSPRSPALAFIFIVVFLDVLGIGLIVPILPALVEQFAGGGEAKAAFIYGWLAALYSLMQFIFAPFLGSLSDRYGRRPVILFSLLGAGLDYFLIAFAPNLIWFFLARIVAGVAGANFSAATAYIADISPPEKRGANFGLIGAAFGLGFVIGPAIGGGLAELGVRAMGEQGMKLPFFVAGAITLLNWAYGFFILPESLPLERRRPFSWRRANPFGALMNLRRYPVVLGLAAALFLASIAHQVYPGTWVLYTKYRFDWGPLDVGVSLALVGLMAALVSGGLTRVVIPRIGDQKTAILGLLVAALAFCLYALATAPWMIFVFIMIGSLGGLATPAIQGMVSNAIGDDEQGEVQGALTGLQSVASFIGLLTTSQIFAFFISEEAPVVVPGAAFFFSASLVLAAAGLAGWSMRKHQLIGGS